MPEGGHDLGVGVALERHDHMRQLLDREPFPGREFRLMGRKIDGAVIAQEIMQKPAKEK